MLNMCAYMWIGEDDVRHWDFQWGCSCVAAFGAFATGEHCWSDDDSTDFAALIQVCAS